MATEPETFHLATVSMQRDDPPRQIVEDLETAFDPDSWGDNGVPDLIGFTEATPGQTVRPYLAAAATDAGYPLNLPATGDVVTAVHPRHTITELSSPLILEARSGYDKGNYAARRIVETRITTAGGNDVTDHGMHWLTAYRLDRDPGPENRRERLHLIQSERFVERVKLHSLGDRISLWHGDLNVDEKRDTGFDDSAPHAVFAAAGLRSGFDELKVYPPTHGDRSIDVSGTVNSDLRVSVLEARSYRRGNSDHRRTSLILRFNPLPAGEIPVEVEPPVDPSLVDPVLAAEIRRLVDELEWTPGEIIRAARAARRVVASTRD